MLESNGFVRLDAAVADDLSVVNSARVSFGKKVDQWSDAETGLIKFLMREHHGTPFEHNFFRFHVRAPIFVAREWFRHRSGWSYNEFSGRYSEMPEGAWVPDDNSVRTQVGKPGYYTFEQTDEETTRIAQDVISEANGQAWQTYQYLLTKGIAKEVARTVLPVGTYTEFYASCNARSLMHFCALRNHASAQKEIRSYAVALEECLKDHMPETYSAFCEFGRIAP
jgi:thymidylate synthase (FAD)